MKILVTSSREVAISSEDKQVSFVLGSSVASVVEALKELFDDVCCKNNLVYAAENAFQIEAKGDRVVSAQWSLRDVPFESVVIAGIDFISTPAKEIALALAQLETEQVVHAEGEEPAYIGLGIAPWRRFSEEDVEQERQDYIDDDALDLYLEELEKARYYESVLVGTPEYMRNYV
ncbi:hypothetical protein CMUST_09205 [Corynebacterium mustelae]|uniref:Uncharacterized protein n=1 Tax=Corynebacterium mustelae TaxID=571915 RepID=A0A0G3H4Z8_9CORY|nr:hypothetical protein [Corynebacterium mustelae]AKK06157.1 hypothetical protein CMUST_09205 [Corynebacterium mustelae]